MNSFWRFLRDKRNQQVLGWLGGGLVVAVTGLWAAFGHLSPSPKPPEAKASKPASISVEKPASVSVQADCSGIAIGGNVSGAIISTGATTNSDCAPKPK
jgi:hypothetical protein